jgi:hypothetical protein
MLKLPSSNLTVRYTTSLCDSSGKVIRELQTGHNEITDWGMDAIATASKPSLCSVLNLSSALGPAARKGTGSGTVLTLAVVSPSNIGITTSAGFFLAGDVGETLYIDALGQELKIIAYASATSVTCATRQGFWLPTANPALTTATVFGVHFTSIAALTAQFTTVTTFDTAATNYYATLTDSPNSRFILQRIFLSDTVTGSPWTVNQLGWSNGSINCLGKANLASPDVIAVGQRYRVQLQVFSGYTPVNIASQTVDWGATIGAHDLAIKQETVYADGTNGNFLDPLANLSAVAIHYSPTPITLAAVTWQGDPGYTPDNHPSLTAIDYSLTGTDAGYVSGTHYKARTLKMADTIALPAAAAFELGPTGYPMLTVNLNSGTVTKPIGYWAALTFNICWTRGFTN